MSSRKSKKHEHTSLVTLSPIEYRSDDPDGRLKTVSTTLEAESNKKHADQILRQCPMVHMARLQIIDDVIPPMGQQPPDSLKSKYLLFVADVDGSIEDFFDSLYNGALHPFDWAADASTKKQHADFVQSLWGQCIGYPQDRGCVFFRRYLQRCRIKVSLPFAAYDFTVAEIIDAKEKQAMFARFVAATQDMGPDELFSEWEEFRDNYEYSDAKGHLVINKSGFLRTRPATSHASEDDIPVPPKSAQGRQHADGRMS
jgi:hypothetical protein